MCAWPEWHADEAVCTHRATMCVLCSNWITRNSHAEVLSTRRCLWTRCRTVKEQCRGIQWIYHTWRPTWRPSIHEPSCARFVSSASRQRGGYHAPDEKQVYTVNDLPDFLLNMQKKQLTRQSIAAYDCVGEYSNKTPSSGLELRGTTVRVVFAKMLLYLYQPEAWTRTRIKVENLQVRTHSTIVCNSIKKAFCACSLCTMLLTILIACFCLRPAIPACWLNKKFKKKSKYFCWTKSL